MTERTPSPWQAEVTQVANTGEIERGVFSCTEENPLGGQRYVVPPSSQLREGDMHLLAAAPQLLEALKEIREARLARGSPLYKLASRAIDKAEGTV